MSRSILAFMVLAATAAADDSCRGTSEYVTKQLEETRFTFQGEDVPFEDVMKVVRETALVNLVVDRLAYRVAGEDLKVTISVRDLKMKNALQLILSLDGLDWKYSCGAVVVSTPELLKRFPDEPVAPPADAGEDAVRVHRELASQVVGRLEFEQHPLTEVAEFLRDNFDLNLMVDPDLTRGQEVRVSLQAEDISLAQGLNLLTLGAGLEYEIQEGVIVIRRAPDPLAASDQCPFCGGERKEAYNFCPECGEKLRR